MKLNKSLPPAVFFAIVMLLSFTAKKKKPSQIELKADMPIEFSQKLEANSRFVEGNATRSSYDGKRYEVKLDSLFICHIRNVNQAPVATQAGMNFIYSNGSIRLHEDTVFVNLRPIQKYNYFINLEHGSEYFRFEGNLTLKLVGRDLQGNKVWYPLDGFYGNKKCNPSISVLPLGIPHEQLFMAFHEPNTLANFVFIEVEDQNGKREALPAGSYIVCEGNEIDIK